MVEKAVDLFNEQRPHQSLKGHSPHEFKALVEKGLLIKIWVINKKKKFTWLIRTFSTAGC